MNREVFLEKYRSKKSVNVENKLGISLSTKNKVFMDSSIDADFSLYEQYNAERDACEKYRMIFFVNTVASNVLFNMQSEVIKDEGSDNIKVIDAGSSAVAPPSNTVINTTRLDLNQAIRDTEYSHPENGGYVYHCGIDIFNNHMLRSNTFVHVNKIGNFNESEYHRRVYNTISDYMRDGEGKPIKKDTNPLYTSTNNTSLHLYTVDNCYTFKTAYTNRVKEKDGWIGFYNPGNIDIPNSDNTSVLINKMMANNKPCEFIDLYPDRSLYSFVPKYNKYRNRVERNWDYYITYPFSSDTSIINIIFGGENQCLKAAIVENGYSQSSIETLTCRTFLKHTFKTGDDVAIYYNGPSGFTKFSHTVRIYSTGDENNANKDMYFSIRIDDVKSIYGTLLEDGLYYKKVVRNQECEYYARLYTKLKIVDADGNRSGDLRSDLTKASFSENIYGDRVAQVVFTDDINVEGLTDNLGRKLSEVYFTAIKTNRGKDEWKQMDYSNSNVEFSHCFGNVTCGLYFGDDTSEELFNDDIDNNYNVRKINGVNNIALIEYLGNAVLYGSGMNYLKDEDVFYGDIVEFDKYNFTETQLSPFMHRFNTLQRELELDVKRGDIVWDNIVSDDYDTDENGRNKGFQTREEHYAPKVGTVYAGHVSPEGYFYNPHTTVHINELSDRKSVQAKQINFYSGATAEVPISTVKHTIVKMKYPTEYDFLVHDIVGFYDAGSEDTLPNTFFGEIKSIDKESRELTIRCEGDPFKIGLGTKVIGRDTETGRKRYYAYYSKDAFPTYSVFVPSINSFVWRDIVPQSELSVDNELFDTPFSNGRLYIEKNIDLFVRRQDPQGKFGLLYAKGATKANKMEFFRLSGSEIDLSSVYNFYNNINNICY